MRQAKVKHLKALHDRKFTCRDDLQAISYKNATILPVVKFPDDNLAWGRCGVLDENGSYIKSCTINGHLGGSYAVSDVGFLDERVVYCGYFNRHWGHFLVDAVSRLWYFLEGDTAVDKYVFVVEKGEEHFPQNNFAEFFRLLGIAGKVQILNTPTRFREVIVPEMAYDRGNRYYSPRFAEIFNAVSSNVIAEEDWGGYNKVFFSRSKLPKARQMELGMDMLDDYFARNGFLIVHPQEISLSKLIYLINNSSVCATISGTLPHNMLFSNGKQELVIVERNVINNYIQCDINIIKGLRTTYIDGNLCFYPVELSYGPFIYYYNACFEHFSQDRQYLPPKRTFCSENYTRNIFREYMKRYEEEYYMQWYMPDWMIGYTDSLYEAYEDGVRYCGDYINGHRAYAFHQHFTWRYIKRVIKKMLRK